MLGKAHQDVCVSYARLAQVFPGQEWSTWVKVLPWVEPRTAGRADAWSRRDQSMTFPLVEMAPFICPF